jgi:ketosteroid isomerase-like protein
MRDASEVKAAVESLFEVIRAKDYDDILARYLDDPRLFIFLEGWEGKVEGFDRDFLDAGWRRLLERVTFTRIEFTNDVRAGREGDLGWVGGTIESSFEPVGGERVDVTQRGTWILELHDGRWVIVFEHVSFPVENPYGTG